MPIVSSKCANVSPFLVHGQAQSSAFGPAVQLVLQPDAQARRRHPRRARSRAPRQTRVKRLPSKPVLAVYAEKRPAGVSRDMYVRPSPLWLNLCNFPLFCKRPENGEGNLIMPGPAKEGEIYIIMRRHHHHDVSRRPFGVVLFSSTCPCYLLPSLHTSTGPSRHECQRLGIEG